jgi:hypothetical protein
MPDVTPDETAKRNLHLRMSKEDPNVLNLSVVLALKILESYGLLIKDLV